jgi:hypothetical protein
MFLTLQRHRVRVEFGSEVPQPLRADRVIHGSGKLPNSDRQIREWRKAQKVGVHFHGDAWMAGDARRPCSRGLTYNLFAPRQTST